MGFENAKAVISFQLFRQSLHLIESRFVEGISFQILPIKFRPVLRVLAKPLSNKKLTQQKANIPCSDFHSFLLFTEMTFQFLTDEIFFESLSTNSMDFLTMKLNA